MKLTPAVSVPTPLTMRPKAQKSVAAAAGEGVLGQRCVGEPADGRGAAGGEAEIDEQAAEQRHPESHGVQPREGHVAGADHQRHEVVADADQDRHAHEEHHRRAVHGEQLIERVGPEQVVARAEQAASESQRLARRRSPGNRRPSRRT